VYLKSTHVHTRAWHCNDVPYNVINGYRRKESWLGNAKQLKICNTKPKTAWSCWNRNQTSWHLNKYLYGKQKTHLQSVLGVALRGIELPVRFPMLITSRSCCMWIHIWVSHVRSCCLLPHHLQKYAFIEVMDLFGLPPPRRAFRRVISILGMTSSC
jgi:hypothetical protein